MLIESANAPIFGIDTAGRVTEWNKKAAEITGYTAQEMLGHLLVDAAPIKREFKFSVSQVCASATSPTLFTPRPRSHSPWLTAHRFRLLLPQRAGAHACA